MNYKNIKNFEKMTKKLSLLESKVDHPKNDRIVKVLYKRVSCIEQKSDRQTNKSENYDLIIEDKCSGIIPFFEREGGKKVKTLIELGHRIEIDVHSIDRICRCVRDLLNIIHYFNSKKVGLFFISQGLKTIDEEGNENPIARMVIAILGVVADIDKQNLNQRTMEGVAIAKALGKYKGRLAGSQEDVHCFLSKPRNKKALEYLKKGYKISETAKITGLAINTISKIKKLSAVNV